VLNEGGNVISGDFCRFAQSEGAVSNRTHVSIYLPVLFHSVFPCRCQSLFRLPKLLILRAMQKA